MINDFCHGLPNICITVGKKVLPSTGKPLEGKSGEGGTTKHTRLE